MLDLILLTFSAGLFAGGFWCGSTYGTVKTMGRTVSDLVYGWFRSS